jgi:hypothetical protein
MTALGALAVLAVLDAAFAGFRAAAGRSALIDKRAYYRAALGRGAAHGVAAVTLAGAVAGVLVGVVPEGAALVGAYEVAAVRALWVFGPYAAVLLVALALRTHPSVDVRSLLSVLLFGPLTLVRPLVVVTGLTAGVLAARRWEVLVLALLVLPMMLGLEAWLGRRHRGMSPLPLGEG